MLRDADVDLIYLADMPCMPRGCARATDGAYDMMRRCLIRKRRRLCYLLCYVERALPASEDAAAMFSALLAPLCRATTRLLLLLAPLYAMRARASAYDIIDTMRLRCFFATRYFAAGAAIYSAMPLTLRDICVAALAQHVIFILICIILLVAPPLCCRAIRDARAAILRHAYVDMRHAAAIILPDAAAADAACYMPCC